MIPIVFHPGYAITAFGLEKAHPFDSAKYGKIKAEIERAGLRRPRDFVRPETAGRAELLAAHDPGYLASLGSSRRIAEMLELPFLAKLPAWFLDRRVLLPMRRATGGTILACRLALSTGLAINLGGGFHHASGRFGGGFCVYADVPTACAILRAEGALGRVLVVDVDAHQGNGTAAAFLDLEWAAMFDLYDRSIFPREKVRERYGFPLPAHADGPEYLDLICDELPAALEDFRPDLVVLNAGSDPFVGDPLATLCLARDEIAERDRLVVELVRSRGIPLAMVLSGGYSRESAGIHADSIIGILRAFDSR